jgi:hypothetical protein
MALKNQWVGYVQRGYLDIKNSILNKIRVNVPELTDFSESNIFVIITSIFAGLIEQINYYIDQLMRESFLVTARRYTSLIRHARMFDYRVKAANPASTVLTVTFFKSGNYLQLGSSETETIPKNTIFTSNNGLNFVSTRDSILTQGNYRLFVPVKQFTELSDSFIIGSTDPDQSYSLGTNYVHDSISLSINSEIWEQVTSFGLSSGIDKHFIVDIGIDGIAYIRFGDGIRGAIPPINGLVEFSYRETLGSVGNIGANTITSDPGISWDFADYAEVNNDNPVTGGIGYEDIESIRRSLPLSLRTLDRAVTRQDYIDIVLLHPGVNKAGLIFECGKFVEIYVSPMGGGIAQEPLLLDIKEWFDRYRMITTFVEPKAAGETLIHLNITVTPHLTTRTTGLVNIIRDELLESFGYENSDINKGIHKSDIYALVDNISGVNYLNINQLFLKPYPYPKNHNNILNFTFEALNIRSKAQFRLIFIGSNNFILFEKGVRVIQFTLNQLINVKGFRMRVLPGNYTLGNEWDINVYPNNQDILINDNSIPVLLSDNLTVNIS